MKLFTLFGVSELFHPFGFITVQSDTVIQVMSCVSIVPTTLIRIHVSI